MRRHAHLSIHRRCYKHAILRLPDTELLERRWVRGAFGGIENFNSKDEAFIVVVDDNGVGDFLAVLDPLVGQIEVDGIRLYAICLCHRPWYRGRVRQELPP